MEVFYQAIGLGLIGRSLLMLHTKQGIQNSPQLEGQLTHLSEVANSGHLKRGGSGRRAGQQKGFWPRSGAVCHCEQVGVATGM